jgi:urea carboxylase
MRGYILFAGGLDIAGLSRQPQHLRPSASSAAMRRGGCSRATRCIWRRMAEPSIPGPPHASAPEFDRDWTIRVLYGPHGAPDFFTDDDIATIVTADWQVHYNSNRTGVAWSGPSPQWARTDGGEAGLHPSNIHDNPYAIGAVDFTGDMPIILGPDGPSLGGFVCPFVVIAADLWKIGQLAPGDTSGSCRRRRRRGSGGSSAALDARSRSAPPPPRHCHRRFQPILADIPAGGSPPARRSTASRATATCSSNMAPSCWTGAAPARPRRSCSNCAPGLPGVIDIVPGIRSLQVHYDGTAPRRRC